MLEINTPVLNSTFHTPRSITDIYQTITSIDKDATKLRLIGYFYENLLLSSASIQVGQVALLLSANGLGTLVINNEEIQRPTSQDVLNIVAVEISETVGVKTAIQYALFTWD